MLRVELQQTLIWKFFISSSIPYKFTNAHNIERLLKIFCLCNLSSNILSTHQNQVLIYIESTSKCMMLLWKLLVLLQLYSNFHTKWQLLLISIVSNSTSHKLDPYQMQPIAKKCHKGCFNPKMPLNPKPTPNFEPCKHPTLIKEPKEWNLLCATQFKVFLSLANQ